ncbi:hypothetical protein D3C78_1447530 [compost metagenome]
MPLFASSRRVWKICLTTIGASPRDGSSSSSSFGRLISARAMASICCSPPDMVMARWLRRSLRRGNRSNMRCMSSWAWSMPMGMVPISRFSSTLMSGNTRRPSGDWAMPLEAT